MLEDLLSSLPDQFNNAVSGRVLLLDGDGPAYEASATVKTLPAAIRRYQTLVETGRFLTGAETVRVHLTPSGCLKYRRDDYPTVKPYQGNRVDKPKPPLLTPLRNAIASHAWPDYWGVFSWRDREADDGLMQDALYYGDRAVMFSADKDLNITPGPLWIHDEGRLDVIPDRFGWIKTKRLASQTKVVGHGTKFFWAQMLMGDTADNVQGITRLHGKLCGAVGAYEALNHIDSESDAAEFVLRAYMAAKQNPLAEAECLWLRRSNDDSGYQYLSELGLPDSIQQWLDSLHQYHQEVLAYKAQLRDYENGIEEECTSNSPRTETPRSADSDGTPPWNGCDAGCSGCIAGHVQ
ncbi:MAG: hypothetical protein [Caudoviricetes sp.]|nr:MAG: hypothetical protein [Caudoviricetes sp.]